MKTNTTYYQQANAWHDELRLNRERLLRTYQMLLSGLLGVSCVLALALAILSAKKDVVPFLAIADKRTGEVTTPQRLEGTHEISLPMLRHMVRRYVEARESYSPININTPYHQVLSMSTEPVARSYRRYIQPAENRESPITRYGREKYMAVEIESVNQLPGERLLDVRFTQKLIDVQSEKVLSSQDYRITLGWDIDAHAQGLKALELNPLNFKITHYDKQPITV